MENPNKKPRGEKAKEDDFPNQNWSEFVKVDDGYPNVLAPYDKGRVQTLDQSELDPVTQVRFHCFYKMANSFYLSCTPAI